jgi:hypothetical protein
MVTSFISAGVSTMSQVYVEWRKFPLVVDTGDGCIVGTSIVIWSTIYVNGLVFAKHATVQSITSVVLAAQHLVYVVGSVGHVQTVLIGPSREITSVTALVGIVNTGVVVPVRVTTYVFPRASDTFFVELS